MSQPLVSVYRGGRVESVHSGSIAVVDAAGRLIAFAGDPASQTYLRSAAKPFQTLPLLHEGALEEFDLSPEEIALISASHGGEPRHVATAAAILRKGDFDESDLLCGAHVPFDEKAAAELRASGERPSALHNNCSGKHAGMLLGTRLIDAPSATYLDPEHPLQKQIRATLAEFAGIEPDAIPVAIDGCGVPSFFMSLYRAAYAFARFAATAHGESDPLALPRYAEDARQIFEAMTGNPGYVAGSWSITTPLIDAYAPDLLGKEGAEGFYAMALAPKLAGEIDSRFRNEEGHAIGIAIKIADGSMGRGRNPAILRLLHLLGIPLPSGGGLDRFREGTMKNWTGTVVGEVRAEFDLTLL